MCTTCLRSGWRGILERGKQLIAALPISQGSKKSFTSRLKRLWDFIRLQLHLHIEEQSPIAAHCSRLQVGSLAEPRFNQPCTHKHANPDTRLPAPEAPQHQPHCLRSGVQDLDIRQRVGGFLDLTGRLSLSATCRQYRGYWTQEAEESVWTRGHPPPRVCEHIRRMSWCGLQDKTVLSLPALRQILLPQPLRKGITLRCCCGEPSYFLQGLRVSFLLAESGVVSAHHRGMRYLFRTLLFQTGQPSPSPTR